MENKTLKISELIKELEYFKKEEGDIECFVTMTEDMEFLGIQKSFLIKTPNGPTYLCLLPNGDILQPGNILGAIKK